MKQPSGRERRRHPRYRVSGELRARELPLLGSPKGHKGVIRGRVQNISTGGFCVLTDQAMKVSNLVRCEVRLLKIPVAIPVVLQVRWIHRNSEEYAYKVGMQFQF